MENYLKVNNWVNQIFPCLHNFELTQLQDIIPNLKGLDGSFYMKGQKDYPYIQNENNNDIDVNYETFAIDKNSSNQQYTTHNFRIDYQQRPTHYNSLCPYEIFSKTNKINICCHRFNSEHF